MHTLLSPPSPTAPPPAFPHASANGQVAAMALAAGAASHTGNGTQGSQPVTLARNISRPASVSSLPNPHEYHDEPHDSHATYVNRDRALPPTPPETSDGHTTNQHRSSLSGFSASGPSSTSSSSGPPSAFTDPSLYRNSTFSTTTSGGASRLHSEMATYQKRLEVHHEKELLVRDEEAGGGVPLEPPPMYQENLPSTSTVNLSGSGQPPTAQ